MTYSSQIGKMNIMIIIFDISASSHTIVANDLYLSAWSYCLIML